MFVKSMLSGRRAWSAALWAVGVGALHVVPASGASAEPWPSRVEATYRIGFNGFDIGKFDFRVETSGTTYTAHGDAQISALLGAFKWQGVSRSSGALAAHTPRPAGYTFDFNGTGKQGSIKLGFQKGAITSISNLPPEPPQPDTVEVSEAHLKSVLDPLSAVLAISRVDGAGPCSRRIPIFDGKQRFDLAFQYLREQAVGAARINGQPGIAIVCRVRFIPIAGHRMSQETKQMAATEGIEVSFRAVPNAGIYVPFHIAIPTFAGTATLSSERINISTPNEQIALSN